MAVYTTAGRQILCDGEDFLSAARPEMAAQMADTFNEIARHERSQQQLSPDEQTQMRAAWFADSGLERKIRVALADPGRYTPLLLEEPTIVWQARALMIMLHRLAGHHD